MAMNGYSTFPKVLELLEPHHHLFRVISRTLIGGGVLPLSRNAVGVFYSSSPLEWMTKEVFIAISDKDYLRYIRVVFLSTTSSIILFVSYHDMPVTRTFVDTSGEMTELISGNSQIPLLRRYQKWPLPKMRICFHRLALFIDPNRGEHKDNNP